MLIPPRWVSEWATVPGTRTTWAAEVPVVINRGAFEAGMASVVMAYPTSERTEGRAIRLDFRWVVQLRFTSFWAANRAEPAGISTADTTFALNVLDGSPLVRKFSRDYSDPESWGPLFGDRRPEEVIRHFHIVFDDFGMYDVLAVDCGARCFSVASRDQIPQDPSAPPVERAAEQTAGEALLLAKALALPSLPPILSYPIDDQPPEG